jgi:hypothetical protein
VAARLIAAELLGHKSAFADLVRPGRLSPSRAARASWKKNALVVKQLVKDYLTGRQNEKLSALQAGDSAIVDAEARPFAAWRAPAASCSPCRRVHARGLQGALEQRGNELGLPLPRQPLPPGRHRDRRAGAQRR